MDEIKKYHWDPLKGFYFFEDGATTHLSSKRTIYLNFLPVFFYWGILIANYFFRWFPMPCSHLGKIGTTVSVIFAVVVATFLHFMGQKNSKKRMISLGGKPLNYFQSDPEELHKGALSVSKGQIAGCWVLFFMTTSLGLLDFMEKGWGASGLGYVSLFLGFFYGYILACLLYYRWRKA